MIRKLSSSLIILFVIIFVSLTQAQNDGLVGFWSFDDSTAYDSSGYGNHGSVYGEPNLIHGIKGTAFEFDGIDDYILIPDSDWLDTDSSMSISLWIKPDSFAAGGSKFLGKWYAAPQQGDWLFSLSSVDSCGGDCISWYVYLANYGEFGYTSIGASDISNFLGIGEWNYIAVTFDTGYVKSYYNSELINEVESQVKYTSLGEYSTDDIYIGRYRSNYEGYKFFGALDEIRIYERALGESEIVDLYNQVTAIEPQNEATVLPDHPELIQNCPNPFNPMTAISYRLPVASIVELNIYNLLGQKVASLVNDKQKAGYHQVKWDATGYGSGVYYYELFTGEDREVKKMILLK